MTLDGRTELAAPPRGVHWGQLDAGAFAETVGAMRGTPSDQRQAHAQRLRQSPVPYSAHVIRRDSDGQVLACGQFAREGDLVGLYDIFTHPDARSHGLAGLLCGRMLSLSSLQGAGIAYLQVESTNAAALRLYARLGFVQGYSYHYREPPEG
jgi:predicted GNAT family acetyltransferase